LADGTITYTATATDAAGNSATDFLTATKDTVAPLAPTGLTATDPINAANQTSVVVSGSAEPDSTVNISISDGIVVLPVGTAIAGGSGDFTLAGIDVSSLADGPLTVSATATDGAGNTGLPATVPTTKDTVAPMVSVSAVTDPVNAANETGTTASGNVEAGATVSVTVTDGDSGTVGPVDAVVTGGSWSLTGIDVSSLADGTITYTATATDAAGNTATDFLTATKDTVAPSLTVDTAVSVNADTQTDGGAAGSVEAGATVSVTVTDGDSGTVGPVDAVVSGTSWSVAGIDVSTLADGTITYTATATDPAENTATDAMTATKDTVAPTVSVSTVTDPVMRPM
jgi:hypothetical protein